MFQDESVKTILTRSLKAPQAAGHPTSTAESQTSDYTVSGIPRLHLVSANAQVARVQASQSVSLEYISTGSASTISSLLTFFPKCFSSFLHSTCSLSVSYLYLALEEVYLPLGAPVSRYTTLGQPALVGPNTLRGSHPLWRSARADFGVGSNWTNCLQITIRRPNGRRLPVWAFPSSVARTKGILVSFFSSA